MALNDTELEEIEKKYCNIIFDVLSKNLGRIITEISGQALFSNISVQNKTNPIDSKAENTIENIISDQLAWDVCALPVSSDSCYACGDAIVHIDVKTTKNTDDDAPDKKNRINVEAAQTSYVYGKSLNVVTPYSGRGKKPTAAKWQPKLKKYEDHKFFGEVPNITYIIRIIYSDNNYVEELSLVSIPNGQLEKKFNGNNILEGGKSKNSTQTDFLNIRFLVDRIATINSWRNKILYVRR